MFNMFNMDAANDYKTKTPGEDIQLVWGII